MEQCNVARVPVFTPIEQLERVGIIKIFPHFFRIRIGAETVERKSGERHSVHHVQVSLHVAVPRCVGNFQANIEDAAGHEDAVRCEGALDYRASIIEAGRLNYGIPVLGEPPDNPGGLADYEAQLTKADGEIERYC